MYDITQHKKFKAGTVFLILINCALLGVPVSVRCSVARAVKEPEGILAVHIKNFVFYVFSGNDCLPEDKEFSKSVFLCLIAK